MPLSAKHRKEIRRGFRTGFNIAFGILTAVLVMIGTLALSGQDTGRLGTTGAIVMYGIGIAILYWKSTEYSAWIGGFFGLPGVFNSLAVLIDGHALNQPNKPVSHAQALMGLGFAVGLILFTLPFTKAPSLNRRSRVFIVLAVLCFFFGVVNQGYVFVWLTACLALFAVAAVYAMSRREVRALGLSDRRGRQERTTP